MAERPENDLAGAHRRLREFRSGKTPDRLFIQPTCHPSEETSFCWCEGSGLRAVSFCLRSLLLSAAFRLPFNGLKVRLLRRMGAKIGEKVYFSAGAWIDPTFPELISIEDNVFLGMGARVFTHEFRIDEFRAGKVVLRRGAFIGAFAVIPCGVEIGEGAVVAACSVAHRDVPPGATLISPPGRIVRR